MKKILILSALAIALNGCDSHTYDDIIGYTDNPTYTQNIKPVMESNCVSCHQPSYQGDNAGLYLTNYAEVQDATMNGNVACRVDASCGNIMPVAGKMPAPIVKMIQVWKANGCPEN